MCEIVLFINGVYFYRESFFMPFAKDKWSEKIDFELRVNMRQNEVEKRKLKIISDYAKNIAKAQKFYFVITFQSCGKEWQ